MKKHILITGASGFIGRNLLVGLTRENFKISVIGRSEKSPFHKGVKYFQDRKFFLGKNKDIDAVVHLASNMNINESLTKPGEMLRDNFLYLLKLLEFIKTLERKPLLVFASTDRVYGWTKKTIVDESELVNPIEPYTASKILSEIIIKNYGEIYDIPYVILRVDSVYGPGQGRRMFISDVIQKMIEANDIVVGNINVSKNFIYIDDLVDAIIKSLNSKKHCYNEIYNIGGKELVSFGEILYIIKEYIEDVLDKKIRITSDKKHFFRKKGTEVHSFKLSLKKSKECLNWNPKTPIDIGLKNTINWFIKEYENKR